MKRLNEYILERKTKYSGDINNCPDKIKIIYKILQDLLNTEIEIDINIKANANGIGLDEFKSLAIKNSLGYVVESYVLSFIKNHKINNNLFIVKQTDNDIYDADINFINKDYLQVEIKTYRDRTDNINFTKEQKQYRNDNLIYIYIKYIQQKNNIIFIDNILLGDYNLIKNQSENIGKHGGITKNMIQIKSKESE